MNCCRLSAFCMTIETGAYGCREPMCPPCYEFDVERASKSDLGRISAQCVSIQSRHAWRAPDCPVAVHPRGTERKAGHRLYWPSPFWSTRKCPASSSNGLSMLLLLPRRYPHRQVGARHDKFSHKVLRGTATQFLMEQRHYSARRAAGTGLKCKLGSGFELSCTTLSYASSFRMDVRGQHTCEPNCLTADRV